MHGWALSLAIEWFNAEIAQRSRAEFKRAVPLRGYSNYWFIESKAMFSRSFVGLIFQLMVGRIAGRFILQDDSADRPSGLLLILKTLDDTYVFVFVYEFIFGAFLILILRMKLE